MHEPDKDTEQSDKRDIPTPEGVGNEVVTPEQLRKQLEAVKKYLEEKTEKLTRLQIATYKCTTTKQYKLIEQEAEKVDLSGEIKPPEFFYFPKIGMRPCQCSMCKQQAEVIREQMKDGDGGYTDTRLFSLTGIGSFEGHSGFSREDAAYICLFLNKHPEYMHKLENLDKDRYAE